MARTTLSNGQTGKSILTQLNDMFLEIYRSLINGLTFQGVLNTGESVTSTPVRGNWYKIEDAGTYGLIVCSALDELYYNGAAWERLSGPGLVQEVLAMSTGTPGDGDTDNTIETHTLGRTYAAIPNVILSNKKDWDIHIQSTAINSGVVTVVVGIGGSGTAVTYDYDFFVLTPTA